MYRHHIQNQLETAPAMMIGILLGTFAGYMGGWLDLLLSKYADLLLALPTTLVALVVTGLVDGGYWVTVLVLIMLFSPTDIRMVRGSVIAQTGRPYIESAKVLGLGRIRIMFRHILPNVMTPVIVKMSLDMGFAILTVASLGFIGIGVKPPMPEWGLLLSVARSYMPDFWWTAIFPGLAIFLAVFGFNLLGDGLRDVFDPRSKR